MSKKILVLSLVAMLLVSFATGCSNKQKETPVDSEKVTSEDKKVEDKKEEVVVEEGLKEAPILAEKVKAGSLPSVEDRMPIEKDIMIEEVENEIGQYGGDWNDYLRGMDDKWTVENITEEALFRFREDGQGVEPNVAKGYDVNADATEYTIYLREGMKWSDGVPFTADDVLFYWEHMLIPETFSKKLYDCYYSVDPETGEKVRAEVEKVDDYTVKVTHKYPSPLFLERVAIDNKWFFAPAHFYKTILPEFIGEDKALEVAKERGFNDVAELGKLTGYYYWVWPDRPTVRPWVATNDINGDRFIMERNPYYFKTDAEGNQLPYLDRLVFNRTEDESHYTLEAMAGNVDMKEMNAADFTVLKENETAGDYKVITWGSPEWSNKGIHLNQTVEDPNLRKLFQDIRFREAISVAVDRNEIVEIATNGMTVPQQASVPEGLPNYQEGWADQWIEYDVDRASKLLDEIGLKWDENHEFRTFEDGSDLTLVLYRESNGKENEEKYAALLKTYYEAIGIKTNVKPVDKSLLFDLKYDNKLSASISTDMRVVNVALRPDIPVPLRVITPWFGHYGLYTSSKGEQGVKPEGDVAKVLENWNNLVSAKNQEDIDKWADEIIKLHQKNQWIIGYTSAMPRVYVVRNNFKNVPDFVMNCDEFRGIGHARPAQFYKE